jgi:hypothetical protein
MFRLPTGLQSRYNWRHCIIKKRPRSFFSFSISRSASITSAPSGRWRSILSARGSWSVLISIGFRKCTGGNCLIGFSLRSRSRLSARSRFSGITPPTRLRDVGRFHFSSPLTYTHRGILGPVAGKIEQRPARTAKSVSRKDTQDALAHAPHQRIRVHPARMDPYIRIIRIKYAENYCAFSIFSIDLSQLPRIQTESKRQKIPGIRCQRTFAQYSV